MSNELIHSGLTAYLEENYRTAIDQLTKSLERSPDNFKALVYRACSYIKLGNYNTAINDLNNANNLNSNAYEVLYNRAIANFFSSNFKDAQTDLDSLRENCNLTDEQRENIRKLDDKLIKN